MITDIYAGWQGSVHDARVFQRSPLQEQLQLNPGDMCPGGIFVLGNAAYPLKPYLLTPFKNTTNLTE